MLLQAGLACSRSTPSTAAGNWAADHGTYGVFDYRPPLGLDTALIHHLASVVPRFRKAMEQPQA